MTKGKPSSLLIKFMVPLIIGNIFQQLYNMADTIIVGRYVGVGALAAVGATGTIMFLILGFMMGLTTGFTVLTAQRYGAGDLEGLKKSVSSAVVLSVIITIVMTAASVAGMDYLLRLMNTPEDIFAMSRSYIMIICLGMFFTVLYNLTSSILRALGNSKMPLYSLMVAAALNVGLDLFLIIVLQMEVAGAALATVISQAVSGMILVIYIWKKVPLLKLEKSHWRLDSEYVRHQLGIGIPMALQFSITGVGTILVQSALNLFGVVAVAAYTAAIRVVNLATQPYAAIGMTIATFSAQNRGVGDIPRIRRGVNIAHLLSAGYSVVIFGIVFVVFPYVLRLFVGEADYLLIFDYARIYIIICGACFMPLGTIFISRNALQGCGHPLWPTIGGVVELASRAIVAYAAVRMNSFVMICVADGGTWLVTGIFLFIAYRRTLKKYYPSAAVQTADPPESSSEYSPGE